MSKGNRERTLDIVQEEGTVPRGKPQGVLAPFRLSESEIITLLHTLQTEGSNSVDWGDSFKEHRSHKMMKIDAPRSIGTGDIEVDETAMFPIMSAIGEGSGTDNSRTPRCGDSG